jgi:hypothetical protein
MNQSTKSGVLPVPTYEYDKTLVMINNKSEWEMDQRQSLESCHSPTSLTKT